METKKILIVDDDNDVINILKTILEHEGYSVFAAYNKEEALEITKNVTPDLAILDVMMTTHYEGFELAKALKSTSTLKNMPVVMQTSIEVLTTTNRSVEAMAKEYRKDPKFKELQVLLVKDIQTGEAGVDYMAEDGSSVWVPVDGFVHKPVDSNNLLPIIDKLIK